MRINPFFELNGQRFEIKRTRFLIAEYDNMSRNSKLSDQDKITSLKVQSLSAEVQNYLTKLKELEEIYFNTFSDEDEKKYLKIKEMYNNSLMQLAELEVKTGATIRLQKESIDILEKIAILGLAEQYFDMDKEKAKEVWCQYADSLGNDETIEWLNFMAEALFGEDEEKENDFLSQMRKKAQDRADNRKKGMKKVK